MHKKQKQKIAGIIVILLGVGTALALSLSALNKTVTFFFSPTEILGENKITPPANRPFRIGGLVENGSIEKSDDGTISFYITDNMNRIKVEYNGIIPDLFKEGQGVVATGKLNEKNIFIASNILAKHDEKYMPPEVSKALKDTAEKMGHPSKVNE